METHCLQSQMTNNTRSHAECMYYWGDVSVNEQRYDIDIWR